VDIKHGGGEKMPDRYLTMCYACIFDGLPLMELDSFENFIRAHERHDPRIETLADFVQNFNDVMALFVSNNLAREYAELAERNPETFPPKPERLSTDRIEAALRAMRETINYLGSAPVIDAIEHFTHTFTDQTACNSHVRAFLTHPHHIPVPEPPVHGGAHVTIGALLRRLHACAYTSHPRSI
jgi:hypothetical protein